MPEDLYIGGTTVPTRSMRCTFDSADMPTHGVIVGMTGSGSTSWPTSRPGLASS